MIVATAPGKLMLAGEYAVVDGSAPALSLALGVRAEVRLVEGGTGWRVTSPAYDLDEAPVSAVPVIAAALRWCRPADSGHFIVRSDLGAGPTKPGFGSSAAVAVAAAGALRTLAGGPRPTVAEMVAVHREAQGGRGSGYDVATALVGGVCIFDRSDASRPTARAARWVDGLHAAVIFTGQGAKTTRHLRRLERAAADTATREAMAAHAQAASALVSAWEAADVGAVLGAATAAEVALAALDAAGDLGIGGGGQAEARRAIVSAGAVARTSGAGGGDCLWALAAEPHTLAAAVAAAVAAGFSRLDVGLTADEPAGAGLAVGRAG